MSFSWRFSGNRDRPDAVCRSYKIRVSPGNDFIHEIGIRQASDGITGTFSTSLIFRDRYALSPGRIQLGRSGWCIQCSVRAAVSAKRDIDHVRTGAHQIGIMVCIRKWYKPFLMHSSPEILMDMGKS